MSEEVPDAAVLRKALGRYATGVTLVTCSDAGGGFVGLTVNSFAALSLQPPLVLWSLRSASPSLPIFLAAPGFAVNVLTLAQEPLSRRFATSTPDRFAQGLWRVGLHGAPVLADSLAVFECATVSHQEAGDHRLFIGRVLRCSEMDQPPLVYQSGQYRSLTD